jgi:hypothetical protein
MRRVERHAVRKVSLIAGLISLTFGIWHILQVYSCSSWPRVEATVTELTVTYQTNAPLNKRQVFTVSEDVIFRYKYSVEGKEYESQRFFFLFGRLDAGELQRNLPVGTRFPVYHDPTIPSKSIVQPESPMYSTLAGGLVLASIWGLLYAKERRTSAPQ